MFSKGYVYLTLLSDSITFRQRFYVFDSLPSGTDGILGQDFLKTYNAKLDYELNTLRLFDKKGCDICLQFESSQSSKNSYLNVSARCESIFYIDTNITYECFIKSQELCDGVFLASVLACPRNGKIPIKILNTRETDVKLNRFSFEISNLDNYSICTFSKPRVNAERVKELFSVINLNYLKSEEEKTSIKNICAKYSDVFHLPKDKLSVTNIYEHSIQLKPNINPVYVKPYRLPHAQKPEIENQIKQMLNDGIIEESHSEWSSPLLLVPKKPDQNGNKKWRVVVDYRKLNQCIQDDKFPLPNITEILDSLSGAVYFSHLDMYQGYFQTNLVPSSRKYTAFTTSTNQYQMTRLPMGLKTSPSSFSRMVTIAMSGLNYEQCLVYQDDLICFGRNLPQHNQNLINILCRLRKVNLKLNPIKCKFLQKEIIYLGHVVSERGVFPDPEKIKVLLNYPTPKNSSDVKRFVAFAGYYRKFINGFAEIAFPLNYLLKKNIDFHWTEECENAFKVLKQKLVNPPVLQYPDFSTNNEFILQTDASGKSIGAILCNGDGRPVAYASRGLNKSEINYPTIDKELLAIVWGVKYFRPYLYGRKFKIQTDHRPLVYLFSMRDPSSRLLKFRLCLEEYNYVIEYIKGQCNSAADALSRITVTSDELSSISNKVLNVLTRAQAKKQQVANDKTSYSSDNTSTNSRTDHPAVLEVLRKPNNLIELCSTTNKNISLLRKKNLISETSNKYFVYAPSKYTIYCSLDSRSLPARDALVRDLGLLCRKVGIQEVCIIKNYKNKYLISELTQALKITPKIRRSTSVTSLIPRLCIVKGVQRIDNLDDRRVILNDYHLLPTSGHAGIRRMTNNIKKSYYWSSLYSDVKDYVSKCKKCQTQKYSLKTVQPMEITTTAKSSFDKVYLDIVGPLNKDDNGFSYILTLQCELSKFVEAYPLEHKDATSVARAFVEKFILRYGIPREIATDRGSEFISSTMREVCKLLKITQTTSTAYHHESVGALENSHKTMGAYLRINTENQMNSWSNWLPYWCFSYNNTVHSETKYTPHELVFGKICNMPSNLRSVVEPLYNYESYPCELKYRLQVSNKDARENLYKSKLLRKNKYDQYINPVTYKQGDRLLIRNPINDKAQPIYLGPYIVTEDLGVNVKIKIGNKVEMVHKNRTKLFKE